MQAACRTTGLSHWVAIRKQPSFLGNFFSKNTPLKIVCLTESLLIRLNYTISLQQLIELCFINILENLNNIHMQYPMQLKSYNLAISEDSNFSTSSPIIVIICLFHYSHLSEYEAVSHYSFYLHIFMAYYVEHFFMCFWIILCFP